MLLKILYEELMFCSQEEDERDHILTWEEM